MLHLLRKFQYLDEQIKICHLEGCILLLYLVKDHIETTEGRSVKCNVPIRRWQDGEYHFLD